MFRQFSFVYIIFGLSFLSHVATTLGNLKIYGNRTSYKTCDNTATFKHIFHTTLPKCTDECFRRRRCALVMFHQSMNFCALKEFMDVRALQEHEPLCLYHSFDHKTEDSFSKHPCFNHTCGVNERCTEKSESKHDCVKSECPASKKIDNAALLSNTHDIGTTNRYKCNAGYVGIGTPTITCDAHAAWTSTDFVCKQACPQPRKSYFNADLAAVYGGGLYEGTFLHFTCRNGYNISLATATSRCSGGQWHPQLVSCCNGSSLFWGEDCIKIIDVGNARTYDEARGHCEHIGGYLHHVDSGILHRLKARREINWVLQNVTKSSLNSAWNYTACAVANGEADNKSLSFDEKVKMVRGKSWDGDMCYSGVDWKQNEPNGLKNENCVLYERESGLYSDFKCETLPPNVSFVCGFDIPAI